MLEDFSDQHEQYDHHRCEELADEQGGAEGDRHRELHGHASFLERVAQDFAQQHLSDQRLDSRQPYTLLLAVRSWWFAPFAQLRRSAQPATRRIKGRDARG